ncbi:MAG: glycoside hydrolase family 3 C-terminal domain-containing protein [Bacteroidales bacterium]|nr:glycoside hydrolase family 3 C-terminal domain-containing protein [Bacteroidales bacterium]
MRLNHNLSWAAAAFLLLAVSCNNGRTVSGESDGTLPQFGKDPIEEVVAAMTLEEKVQMIVGTYMETVTDSQVAIVGSSAKIIPGAGGTVYPVERLGITPTVLADGPAGLRISPTREGEDRTYYCTYFPIGTTLASTWNQELIEEVGKAIGNEVHEYGVDVLLAPALNIQRNALCGRNFEYYSEDPLIAGKTASAYVKGIQSNDVGACIKHFAANNQETNRKLNDAIVSPRALREIYLKAFEIVVKESQPWTLMTSYNAINGVFTSESKELIGDVLRGDWGYKGTIMSDWFGGNYAPDMLSAGNDMLQPGTQKQYNDVIEAVKNGSLDESVVDECVTRILQMVQKTPRFNGYKYSDNPDLEAHAAITRQSATEGMVLLKNDNAALPIAGAKNIALLGYTSYDFIAGGTGSGSVNGAYTVSLLDGLKGAGYNVDETMGTIYSSMKGGSSRDMQGGSRPDEAVPSDAVLAKLAKDNDVAVITLGRISGEFVDRSYADFFLSDGERQLLEKTKSAFSAVGKKTIVILNIGGVIETASWKDIPDAILLAWQAGQEGGNSVADIISGKVSPSGKLAVTFPVKYEDAGSSSNFPIDPNVGVDMRDVRSRRGMHDRNIDYTVYEEGIYVGYRWFDKKNLEVSYPFGYGLSYSTFEFSEEKISNKKNTVNVSVKVTNTGSMPAKEVVELYVSAPEGSLDKPVRELKAYAKTKELAVGESQTLTLSVPASDLASYDEALSAWVVDAGEYDFQIATSSRNIVSHLTCKVKGSVTKTSDVLHLGSY